MTETNINRQTSRALPAVLWAAGLLMFGSQSHVRADDCNCGERTVEVRGVRGGTITDIQLSCGTQSGNPIEVKLLPDKELEITITVTATGPPEGCGQAYITFPSCGIQYLTHTAGGNWASDWADGDRFAVTVVNFGESNESADPDRFKIRLTKPDSDTADDLTGAGAGAGSGAGGTSTSPPTMEYDPQTEEASIVPPGVSISIPLGPVGLGPDGSAPFRSAGSLAAHGPVAPGLAAPTGFVRNSISEMTGLVTENEVFDGGNLAERHILTPTKAFRMRGWNPSTSQAVAITGATGTVVEEYTAAQYDDQTESFTGAPRASWWVEPVESSPEGVRFIREVNGITTVETVLVDNSGSTLVTEAEGTTTTVQIAPGTTADDYTEDVTSVTDSVATISEARTYERMSWGYEMTGRTVDPTPSQSGDELTYEYGYYDDPDYPISHRRIKYRTEPDGNWALYTYPYDANGTAEVMSPFCSETVLNQDFTAVVSAGQGGSARYILSKETVPMDASVESLETSRELWQVGGESAIAVLAAASSVVEDVTGGTAAGNKDVRITTTSNERASLDYVTDVEIQFSPLQGGNDAWLAGRSLISADSSGRATLHAYQRDGQTDAVIHTETSGLADRTQGQDGVAVADGWYFHVVPSASTQTITTTGSLGVLERTFQYHTGAAFTTAYTESYTYDTAGRLDDVSIGGQSIRGFSYPSPLVTVATEAGAGTTRTELDDRGREVSRTVYTPGGTPLTTTWAYAGLTTTMRVNGRVEETTVTDGLGRAVSRMNGTGATTTTGYTGGGRIVTETGPGGVTKINTSHFDGRPLSLTGTGVVARYSSYDVTDGRLKTTINEAASASDRWTTTIVNRDGSTYQVIKPTFGGTGTVVETNTYHSGTDRLASINSTADHTPTRLFPIDSESLLQRFGAEQVSGLDDGDDTLTLDDDFDRITRTTQTYEVDGGNVYRVTVEDTFPTSSSAAAFTRSRRESLTPAECSDNTYGDGLARSEETIVPGSGTSTRTLTRTTQTFAGAVVVEEDDSATTASPDSTTTYVTDRPVSRTLPGATTVESWAYDSLGRETRHTDPRGASTITAYNAVGQVETVTDPAGKRTSYTYHPPNNAAAGMVDTITNPLGKTKIHGYDNLRRVTSVSGTATYPLGYDYDDFGALETLTTWRTAGNGSTAAVTTWLHDPSTGLLHKKFYQSQSANDPAWEYSYYADGRVHTRESLEGRVTTYTYNDFGDPATLTYTGDEDLTPDVTYSGHDRLGRPGSVSVGGDIATLTYDPISGAESITYAENHSYLPDVAVVADDADAAGRPTGFEVTLDSTPAHANTLAYAADLDHLSSVTSAAGSTVLAWYPGSSILRQATTTAGGNVVRRETRTVDLAGRVTGVHTAAASGTLAAAGYTVDDLGRRTTARREDGSTWTYGYNDRSEVISGSKRLPGSGNTPGDLAKGLQFDYAYDDIGNRKLPDAEQEEPPLVGEEHRQIGYQANALNQYTSITTPRFADVLVRSPDSVSVSSAGNSVTIDDQGTFNRAEIEIGGTTPDNPQWVPVNVTTGTLTTQGHLWLPAAEVEPQYDADGNLEDDGRWVSQWDAENRLVSMRPTQAALTAGAPNIGLDFKYDHRSRRIAKKVINLAQQAPNNLISDLRFAYDGWNLVAEFEFKDDPEHDPEFSLLRSYTLGPDLSNTLQGAGGVGGLLAVTVHGTPSTSYYPAMDGNGNIIAWSDSSGAVLRRIDYDPFGNVRTVENAATAMPAMPVGFSTKYTDEETGLVYYIFRYYDPVTGRWMSMDPIGEEGGLNLYAFANNQSLTKVDRLGAIPLDIKLASYYLLRAETRLIPFLGPLNASYPDPASFSDDERELAREFGANWLAAYRKAAEKHVHEVNKWTKFNFDDLREVTPYTTDPLWVTGLMMVGRVSTVDIYFKFRSQVCVSEGTNGKTYFYRDLQGEGYMEDQIDARSYEQLASDPSSSWFNRFTEGFLANNLLENWHYVIGADYKAQIDFKYEGPARGAWGPGRPSGWR